MVWPGTGTCDSSAGRAGGEPVQDGRACRRRKPPAPTSVCCMSALPCRARHGPHPQTPGFGGGTTSPEGPATARTRALSTSGSTRSQQPPTAAGGAGRLSYLLRAAVNLCGSNSAESALSKRSHRANGKGVLPQPWQDAWPRPRAGLRGAWRRSNRVRKPGGAGRCWPADSRPPDRPQCAPGGKRKIWPIASRSALSSCSAVAPRW